MALCPCPNLGGAPWTDSIFTEISFIFVASLEKIWFYLACSCTFLEVPFAVELMSPEILAEYFTSNRWRWILTFENTALL